MEKKITLKEAIAILEKAKEQIKEMPYLRLGQSFFNLLYEAHPEVADSIRATKRDPFYQDRLIQIAIKYISTEKTEPLIPDDEIEEIFDSCMSSFWDQVNNDMFASNYTDEQKEYISNEIALKLKH